MSLGPAILLTLATLALVWAAGVAVLVMTGRLNPDRRPAGRRTGRRTRPAGRAAFGRTRLIDEHWPGPEASLRALRRTALG
jgi:hypothetical protein